MIFMELGPLVLTVVLSQRFTRYITYAMRYTHVGSYSEKFGCPQSAVAE